MSAGNRMAAFIRRNSIMINGVCLPLIVLGVAAIFAFMIQVSASLSQVRTTQTMMSSQFVHQNGSVDAILNRIRAHDTAQDSQIQDVRDMARDNANAIDNLDARVDRLEKGGRR